jgi:hypothetical protein
LPEELPATFSKPNGTGVQFGSSLIEYFKPTNEGEKYYEQAYFPDQVCDASGQCNAVLPITGQ